MQLPARVGKYELQQFLGGGMSHVYRAQDTVIGRTVAVKILTDAGCQDTEAKARFLAEARMAGNIAHDNVISIYDFGEDEQHRPFMVMEFLKGQDLRHAIKNGQTGDLRSKLKIALQAARALQYIHEQGIVHRDIKPENVHINQAGVVKLMDFGIAKTEGLAMTRAGYVLGTPYYMAPEQVTGQNITGQVDVYAFGVMLFELLCGAKPIDADTVERIFYSILNEPLKLDPLYQAAIPQAICDLVAKCTAKNPSDRPQGFGPVCAEIESLIANLGAATVVMGQPSGASSAAARASAPAPQPASTPKAARPAWVVAAIACLLVAILAGGYFVLRPKPAGTTEAKTAAPASAPAGPAQTISTSTGDMVLVPAGEFEFGKDKLHTTIPAFYIDKTEVTNAAYQEFCSATARPLPDQFPAGQPTLPVVNVSINDAHAFAQWAGKRLPSAKEWEKAARGADGRSFPWGNERDASRANLGAKAARPANEFPEGASPYGALQMAGNVWEFVEQLSQPTQEALENFRIRMKSPPTANEPWYMIRGGGFDTPLSPALIWDSTTVPARWVSDNLGFRCAKDAR